MSELRFAIVGAGAIAHSGAKAVEKHEQAKLVAAAEPHAGRL